MVTFAALLRRLRTEAGLTQEELAESAGLSARSVSDLERGVAVTARKDTARLLADALRLTGAVREGFEAVARGRAVADASPASPRYPAAASVRQRPRPGRCRGTSPRSPAGAGNWPSLSARWARPVRAGWWTSMPSAGWPGSERPRSRCMPRTGWRRGSPMGRSSCRCTGTRPGSGRWTRPTRSPACCRPRASPPPRFRPGWRRGPTCGVIIWPASSCCWYSMTPPTASRCAHCCRVPRGAWCWSPAAGT